MTRTVIAASCSTMALGLMPSFSSALVTASTLVIVAESRARVLAALIHRFHSYIGNGAAQDAGLLVPAARMPSLGVEARGSSETPTFARVPS